jgi:hypothetical protein
MYTNTHTHTHTHTNTNTNTHLGLRGQGQQLTHELLVLIDHELLPLQLLPPLAAREGEKGGARLFSSIPPRFRKESGLGSYLPQ